MGNWIKGAIKHPGALHKQLGIKAEASNVTRLADRREHH